jgi:hypothetical protein
MGRCFYDQIKGRRIANQYRPKFVKLMINRNKGRCIDTVTNQRTVSRTDNQSDKRRPNHDQSEMGVKI